MMETRRIQRHKCKPEKLAVYMPTELADKVKRAADKRLMSKSLFVSQVLTEWFVANQEDDQ